MPRFDSDLDHRAYFAGEEPPLCVDCNLPTTLTDPTDRAARCAPCQEAAAERMAERTREIQACDDRESARELAWLRREGSIR